MSRVAVIIPVYNAGKYLEECIQSLLNQDYDGDLSLILVDDCSTDNSSDIMDKYNSHFFRSADFFITHSNKVNIGAAATRNIGIDIATRMSCEFVHFFDADDIAEPNMISDKIDPFKEGKVKLVYSDYWHLGEGGFKSYEAKPNFDYDRLIEDNYISMISMARLKTVNIAGRINEHLTYGEDWSLWLKCCSRGIAVRVAKPLFQYRSHPESLTNSVDWEVYGRDKHIIMAETAVRHKAATFNDLMIAHNDKVRFMAERL